MALFKTTKADGQALGIPPQCIRSVQDIPVPSEDGALTLIRYNLGDGVKVARLKDKSAPLMNRLRAAHPPTQTWAQFALWEKDHAQDILALHLDPYAIVKVEGLNPELPENDGAQAVISMAGLTDSGFFALAIHDHPDAVLVAMEPQVVRPPPGGERTTPARIKSKPAKPK